MQKAYYSDDLMEFKINNKWVKGYLKDIIKEQNKYILLLYKEKDKFEHQNQILCLNNYNLESILKNSENEYSENQRIEFFDESSNSWSEGKIKTKNNDFYIISYVSKTNLDNSKILFKKDIRPLTSQNDLLKLNIHNVQCFSLKTFDNLSNPIKYAKKFIKKLINLLNEKIIFVFLNDNFDLFIFNNEREDDNNLINNDVITGLSDIAFKHFKNIDKANKKLFK